jgi:acyl-CoA synthetase (AMP-forming)/AMP-acid ligase II
VVILKEERLAEKELIDYTRERMAHYKCPKSVDFVDSLPINPQGKVMKRVLKERYQKVGE